MKHLLTRFCFIWLSAALCMPAQAALNVLACEAEWAALASEIGGTRLNVSSATTGQQDPHRIEARPSLIARVRNADLLVCTGLELESGWLPVLLQQSGNRRIQPGQPGNFIAGNLVARLEMPTQLDRAQGDVHGSGNPHIQLNPHNLVLVGDALATRLGELDPANAEAYREGYADLRMRLDLAIQRWEKQAGALKNIGVITHHKDMLYLLDWLGMRKIGNLEPKPGLEPSSAHLAELLQQLRQDPARMVLRTPYQSERASQWLSAQAGIPAVMIPNTVGGTDAATDLFTLFDDIISRLLGGLQ